MWNFKVVAVLLVATMIDYAATRTINITWSRDGTAEYTVDSPLLVSQGDLMVFYCPLEKFSNIWILTDKIQYDNCNCTTASVECKDNQLVASPCTVDLIHSVFINKNSAPLPSVFDYFPGETYYLAGVEPTPSSTAHVNTNSTEITSTTTSSTTKPPHKPPLFSLPVLISSFIAALVGIVVIFMAVVFLLVICRRYGKGVNYPVEKQQVSVEEQRNERYTDIAVITQPDTVEIANHNNTSNIKEDLTQSFQSYEPMKEHIRTSRSSLLMPITDITSPQLLQEQIEKPIGSEVSEKSEADCMAIVPEQQDDNAKACPTCEETVKDTEDHPKEKLELMEVNLKKSTKGPPQLTNLIICPSVHEEESDLINLETPGPHVFSSESIVATSTGRSTRKSQQAMKSLTKVSTATDETSKESDTMRKRPKNKTTKSLEAQEEPPKTPKPQILPRKSKLHISASAMDLNKLADPISEMQRPGTPNPDSKPTPKPRPARKSESELMTSQCKPEESH